MIANGASRPAERQWLVGGVCAVLLHAGVFGALVFQIRSTADTFQPAAMAIDLAPIAIAPPAPVHDVPTPDQVETPPTDPQQIPVEKKIAIDPPPQVDMSVKPDVVLPARAKDRPATQPQPQPPALEATRRASLDAAPAPTTAAPLDGGANSGANRAENAWYARVVGRIRQAKRYPASARMQRQEANVGVRIVIDRTGHLVSVDRIGRPGVPELDQAALDAIRRAAPFPPPPEEVDGDPIVAHLFVQFAITRRS